MLAVLLAAGAAYAEDDLFGPTNALSDFKGTTNARPAVPSASPRQIAALQSLCAAAAPDSDIGEAFGCSASPWSSAPYATTMISAGCDKLLRISAVLDTRLRDSDRSLAAGTTSQFRTAWQIESVIDTAHRAELMRARSAVSCPGAKPSSGGTVVAKRRAEASGGAVCNGAVTAWEVQVLRNASGRRYGMLNASLRDGGLVVQVSNIYPFAVDPSQGGAWLGAHCQQLLPQSPQRDPYQVAADHLTRWVDALETAVTGRDPAFNHIEEPCERGVWRDLAPAAAQARCTKWLQLNPGHAATTGVRG